MIPVEHYTSIYYILLSVVIVLCVLPLGLKNNIVDFPRINLKAGTFLILLVTIAFIGLRDPNGHWSYFGDTSAYTRTFDLIQEGIKTEFNKDVGFYVFMKLCSQIMGIQGFYIMSAIIYVVLPYLTFKKWFGQYVFFALAVFVTAMSFWAFGINGVRNGLASSIFIFALGFRNKKWLMYGLMILSITFHKSMMLPMISFIIASYYKNTKTLMIFWLLTIPVSLVVGKGFESVLSSILSSDSIIGDNRGDAYLTGALQELASEQRFRLDFVLYSAAPILLGRWFLFKRNYSNDLYSLLLNTYLIANGIWIMLIYIPYTNRVAYLSWFLMPILLIYPFLIMTSVDKLNKKITLVILGSLAFTIIMYIK